LYGSSLKSTVPSSQFQFVLAGAMPIGSPFWSRTICLGALIAPALLRSEMSCFSRDWQGDGFGHMIRR